MPNQLKVGSMLTPSRANGGISPGCIIYTGCHQATTDTTCTEDSGSGIYIAPGASLVPATQFATPQGITTVEADTTDKTVRIVNADYSYSYNNGDTLLIHTRVKLTALPTGASKPLWAQGGNSTAAQGLRLNVASTTGLLLLALDGPSTTQFFATTDQAGAANNGAMDISNWRNVTFAWWSHVVGSGANGTSAYSIWIDGEPAYSGVSPYRLGSALPSPVVPVESYRIGAYYRSSGPTFAPIGAIHSNHHIYRAPNAVANSFAKMNALAKRLHLAPHLPLSLAEWPMS